MAQKGVCTEQQRINLDKGRKTLSTEEAREMADRSTKARNKKKSLRETLELMLEMKSPSGKSNKEQMIYAQISEANEGNTQAFNAVFDRVDGKPIQQTVNVEVDATEEDVNRAADMLKELGLRNSKE